MYIIDPSHIWQNSEFLYTFVKALQMNLLGKTRVLLDSLSSITEVSVQLRHWVIQSTTDIQVGMLVSWQLTQWPCLGDTLKV